MRMSSFVYYIVFRNKVPNSISVLSILGGRDLVRGGQQCVGGQVDEVIKPTSLVRNANNILLEIFHVI